MPMADEQCDSAEARFPIAWIEIRTTNESTK